VLAPSRLVPYVATAANPCPAKSLVNEITIASAVDSCLGHSSHGASQESTGARCQLLGMVLRQ